MTQVALFIGSASDAPVVNGCADVLKKLGISYRYTVTSAHRTPERTEQLMRELEEDGCQVYICAAGMAAHLAGAVAARTIKPVIGIPMGGSALNGVDALYATVQMPTGFPVATVAIDGAKNAAWLAAQILALHDPAVAELIRAERESYKASVEKASAEIELNRA
ncbi:5-(carboxyamino)imidazole ribonucleotide mutase [uncultured Mailhella sp.]|uniref:5-(carboxyamino)imidazole ribonucleotide mutase n=1 Tax=uncultured Mailhella sp. TaxID=1981031 RepID=UPI0026272FCF|nr:5-(carboxyamino)imidazole ribonucleotide mutase [uncultured Mailhella sp.]